MLQAFVASLKTSQKDVKGILDPISFINSRLGPNGSKLRSMELQTKDFLTLGRLKITLTLPWQRILCNMFELFDL